MYRKYRKMCFYRMTANEIKNITFGRKKWSAGQIKNDWNIWFWIKIRSLTWNIPQSNSRKIPQVRSQVWTWWGDGRRQLVITLGHKDKVIVHGRAPKHNNTVDGHLTVPKGQRSNLMPKDSLSQTAEDCDCGEAPVPVWDNRDKCMCIQMMSTLSSS